MGAFLFYYATVQNPLLHCLHLSGIPLRPWYLVEDAGRRRSFRQENVPRTLCQLNVKTVSQELARVCYGKNSPPGPVGGFQIMQSQMVVPTFIPSRSESMVKTARRSFCRIFRIAWRHTVAIVFEQILGETASFELYVG